MDIYYACKIIAKQRVEQMRDKTRFEQEIRILQEMRHPRIVQLYGLYKDSLNYYIMMEYCPNGELFSHIFAMKKLTEPDARLFFKNVCDGLAFIHSFNIAHRDLKPENVLIDAEGHAKISDFGLSKYVGTSGITSTICGSPCYAAPEVLSGNPYNAIKSDMWSLGVILYVMVTGQMPWSKRNRAQLFHQIRKGRYHIPPYLSQDCSNLIRALMNLNVESRLNVQGVLAHAFMKETMDELIVCKEVPLVSLRRLDQFFEREESKQIIRMPARPGSFDKRPRDFKEIEKLVIIRTNKEDNKKNEEPALCVRPSATHWIQPGMAAEITQAESDEAQDPAAANMNWKAVLKKQKNKPHHNRTPSIVKPKVNSNDPIANLT